jgi:alkylation response protein AidB-like acyl-CoA dehydrogenase
MDLIGPAGLVWDGVIGPWSGSSRGLETDLIVDTWVNGFSRTIAAGTSQIQRNIISERLLGMPKEPKLQLAPTEPQR